MLLILYNTVNPCKMSSRYKMKNPLKIRLPNIFFPFLAIQINPHHGVMLNIPVCSLISQPIFDIIRKIILFFKIDKNPCKISKYSFFLTEQNYRLKISNNLFLSYKLINTSNVM